MSIILKRYSWSIINLSEFWKLTILIYWKFMEVSNVRNAVRESFTLRDVSLDFYLECFRMISNDTLDNINDNIRFIRID